MPLLLDIKTIDRSYHGITNLLVLFLKNDTLLPYKKLYSLALMISHLAPRNGLYPLLSHRFIQFINHRFLNTRLPSKIVHILNLHGPHHLLIPHIDYGVIFKR
jgi:hypothetical protein